MRLLEVKQLFGLRPDSESIVSGHYNQVRIDPENTSRRDRPLTMGEEQIAWALDITSK